MRRCPSCGATGPGPTCAYCGTDVSAVPAAAPETLLCPACADPAALEPVALGGVSGERCPDCRGTWFPRGHLRRLLEASRPAAGAPEPAAAPLSVGVGPVRYRRCPLCGQLMHRQNHGRTSGVIVDLCRAHGVWLDEGELAALQRYVASGGSADETPPPLPPPPAPDRADAEWREVLRRVASAAWPLDL